MYVGGFIDLWIDVKPDLLRHVIDIARSMGYSVICIEDRGLGWRVKRFNNLLVVRRRTIIGSSEDEVKELLKGIKVNYPIVSVKPIGRPAARLAARDGRVDTIILDPDTIEFIDKTQALMMKEYGKILEIPIMRFVDAGNRVKAMIYRRILLFRYYGIPIVFSSGARDWNEIIHPRSMVAFLSQVFGLDRSCVITSISTVPRELLVRNGVKP